jgi:hypothetical protein
MDRTTGIGPSLGMLNCRTAIAPKIAWGHRPCPLQIIL